MDLLHGSCFLSQCYRFCRNILPHQVAGRRRRRPHLEINAHLDHVCFPEFTFRETIFQTFLCLFAIRKVGQRKTLSGQRKTLSSQRKIWFGFQESVFPFGCVCFPESGFRETTFQISLCLFAIRKVGQRKTLSNQRKI